MKAFQVVITLFVLGLYAMAQHSPDMAGHQAPSSMPMPAHSHDHNENAPAVSFAELERTAAQLDRVREMTAKYRDVRVAMADGYKQTETTELPGMGIHFVRELEPTALSLEKPPILVYEKNSSAPGGFALAGVAYILADKEGPDGQPVNNPFPKPLAIWHHHANVCMLPPPHDPLEHTTKLSEAQCKEQGGHFNDEWMIHAWVWKDSPLGVFSPRNPRVAIPPAKVEAHTTK